MVANCRFLILPGAQVPNPASHVLALALKRLSADWQARYAIAPVLVETFVDSTRYRGTCYRTANWRHLGQTQGRGRQDRAHAALGMSKGIWVYLKDSMDLRTKQRNECCNPGRLVTVWQTNGAPPVDWRKPLIHMASPRGFEPRLPP